MLPELKVKCLRPKAMQSEPLLVGRVFDDPDRVIAIIRERAPYPNLFAFHNMLDSHAEHVGPRFRQAFDDEMFLHNPQWIAAARTSFSASIVRPFKCLLNANGPMGGGGVHLDLPVYRGLDGRTAPVWLLMNMSNSGLFQDWMVPIASGLAWFYRGVGGAFAYWPDGPNGPVVREEAPLWNRGVMSDNEYMWHAVAATGSPEEQQAVRGKLAGRDRLQFGGDGRWDIRDEHDRVKVALRDEQVRISLLWKAFVFKDDVHLASFEDRSMDLTIERVVDIYVADLAGKGVHMSPPRDLLADADWRRCLELNYPQPFSESMAGDYR